MQNHRNSCAVSVFSVGQFIFNLDLFLDTDDVEVTQTPYGALDGKTILTFTCDTKILYHCTNGEKKQIGKISLGGCENKDNLTFVFFNDRTKVFDSGINVNLREAYFKAEEIVVKHFLLHDKEILSQLSIEP